MKFTAAKILLISTLLAGATSAGAQYPAQPFIDRGLFDRVRADLDRASAYAWASRADQKRFDQARRELFDFESRFDRGRYDRHELDQAISRMQKVVSQNSLDPGDRGALENDLRRMRDYRAFREHEYRR
jgi:hypothetical protein